MVRRRVIILPDMHFPFVHTECLNWLIDDVIKFKKPDIVVQIGDLLDQFSFSKFSRTHNLMTPKEEIDSGLVMADIMWSRIKKVAPDAMRVQILGNHDVRLAKRVLDDLPELEGMAFDWMAQKYQFKGVKTILDPKQEVEIDGVVYIHGHYSKLGDHLNFFQQSVVHGHTHRGGFISRRIKDETLFELDAGFCSDENSIPMRYGATRRIQWTLGGAEVDKWGPASLIYPHQPIKTAKVL